MVSRSGASSSRSTWSIVSAFGSRCACFGGRSRVDGSAGSMPSRARNRCSPRTEDCRRARLDAATGGCADARSAANSATSRASPRAESSDAVLARASRRSPPRSRRYAATVWSDRPRSIEICRRYASTARSSRMSVLRRPRTRGAARSRSAAASTPVARMPLRSRPSSTPVTASANGTHSMRMSASSASRACAWPTGDRPGREEHVHDLVVAAGGREDAHERLPVGRDEVGLFEQLALRRLERRLAGDVEQAGGDLPVAMADRMPVLLDQQHPARRRRSPRSPTAPG